MNDGACLYYKLTSEPLAVIFKVYMTARDLHSRILYLLQKTFFIQKDLAGEWLT